MSRSAQLSSSARRNGLKYEPLQKLLGVIATSWPPGASKRLASQTKAEYRLLVWTPRRRSRSFVAEAVRSLP